LISKYMMILGGADLDKRSGNPDVAPVMFTRYMEWVGELQRNGSYVGGHKLHDQGGLGSRCVGARSSRGQPSPVERALLRRKRVFA
jgi:hypothetical protein